MNDVDDVETKTHVDNHEDADDIKKKLLTFTKETVEKHGTMPDRRKITPSVSPLKFFSNEINLSQSWVFSVWRRTPFVASEMPKCLAVRENFVNDKEGTIAVELGEYDDEIVAWKIQPFLDHNFNIPKDSILIQLLATDGNNQNVGFLQSDLSIEISDVRASLWLLLPQKEFLGINGCSSFIIEEWDMSNEKPSGRYLCATALSISAEDIQLLSKKDADEQDKFGNWQYNKAWELCPDTEQFIGEIEKNPKDTWYRIEDNLSVMDSIDS